MHDSRTEPARTTENDPDVRQPAGPLSFAQELLWLMDRASPGTTVWNVSRAFRVRGHFDAAALGQALDALAARHETLRTVFVAADDGARAVVLPPGPVPLRHVDLSTLARDDAQTEAMRLLQVAAQTPFALSSEPLLRAMLIKLGPQERIFSLDTHHIVSDGWSKSVTLRELSVLYDDFARGATAAALPALPMQFAEYVAWERGEAHQAMLADDLTYWRERLAGIDPMVRLPLDRPRPATPTYDAETTVAEFSQPLVDALRDLARERGATLYMALVAGFATVLHRYSGQADVVIGSPSAGRTEAATENLIGFFANTLVLRTDFAGNPTFAELLGRVRETALDAYEHQAVPMEQLVLELQHEGGLAPAPLFHVMMTMEDTLPADLRFAGAEVEALESAAAKTKFDLTLLVRAQPEGLRLTLLYRTDLFESDTAARMLGHVHTVLEAAIREPERRVDVLPLLTEGEQRQLAAWNDTQSIPEPFIPIHEQIAAQAARLPHATAVVCGERRLTYAELHSAAADLQRRLHIVGAAGGAPVGLYLERSVEAIIAMCGILRAGAAFVPLPPDGAKERLAHRLADAGVTTIVTTSSFRSALPAHLNIVTLDEPAATQHPKPSIRATSPNDLAYILFTSGSTGVPKGVAVTHGNLAHYTRAICTRLGVTSQPPWQFATVSTIGADLGHTAIFPALTSGGTLHLVPPHIATSTTGFAAYAATHPIDVLKITPSHLDALLDGATDGTALPRRWLVVGGEACSWNLAERVRSLGTCRMLNHYGPSETTVGATTFALDEDDVGHASSATVPIGHPLRGIRCYVLDRGGEHVPIGVEGELYIGGAGVARGYVNRPELTAEHFVADPFATTAGALLYRTGDRVRRLVSGELEFLGRRDDQVKVRGYRVELGEIESVLRTHPSIERCAVRLTDDADGAPRLKAYVVLESSMSKHETVERLRPWLVERLPDYMLPTSVVVLDRLPLGPNGKLDVTALPDCEASHDDETYVEPRTATESVVAEVIAKGLKLERVGVDDNLLRLGFQSILAIRALGTLSRRFGVRLALRVVFERPTVAQLAEAVDAAVRASNEREFERALAMLDEVPAGERAHL